MSEIREGVMSGIGEGVMSEIGEGVMSEIGEGVMSEIGEGVMSEIGEGVMSEIGEVMSGIGEGGGGVICEILILLTALVMQAIMLTGMRPAPRMRSRLPPSCRPRVSGRGRSKVNSLTICCMHIDISLLAQKEP